MTKNSYNFLYIFVYISLQLSKEILLLCPFFFCFARPWQM